MTKEQVIAWARECGADVDEAANPAVYASFADMQRFAKLVGNAKLEEAAQLCVASELIDMPTRHEIATVRKCAATILNPKEPTL